MKASAFALLILIFLAERAIADNPTHNLAFQIFTSAFDANEMSQANFPPNKVWRTSILELRDKIGAPAADSHAPRDSNQSDLWMLLLNHIETTALTRVNTRLAASGGARVRPQQFSDSALARNRPIRVDGQMRLIQCAKDTCALLARLLPTIELYKESWSAVTTNVSPISHLH